MKEGHCFGLVFYVPFSVMTLTVGWKDMWPAKEPISLIPTGFLPE